MTENTPLESVGGTAPAGFDASALAISEDATSEVQIVDTRTNVPTDIFITVYSVESDRAKAISRQQQNRRFKGVAQRRGTMSLTAEELESEEMDMLVGCTKGWRGIDWKGAPLAFTAENVRMLYQSAPMIRRQVKDAIYDDSLFTRG